MNLKTLFGINGVNGEKSIFNKWATSELKSLFPFTENLKGDSEIVYNQINEFEKFKNSKILIIGGGPSTNEVEWNNLEYDYIFSLNSFCTVQFKVKLYSGKINLLNHWLFCYCYVICFDTHA